MWHNARQVALHNAIQHGGSFVRFNRSDAVAPITMRVGTAIREAGCRGDQTHVVAIGPNLPRLPAPTCRMSDRTLGYGIGRSDSHSEQNFTLGQVLLFHDEVDMGGTVPEPQQRLAFFLQDGPLNTQAHIMVQTHESRTVPRSALQSLTLAEALCIYKQSPRLLQINNYYRCRQRANSRIK